MPLALVITLILIPAFAIADKSWASFVVMSSSYIVGLVVNKLRKQDEELYALRTFVVLFPIYLSIAFIFSINFENGGYYLATDPMDYLDRFMYSRHVYYGLDYIKECYFDLADNNALYNISLNAWAVCGNRLFDGSTVFYMTLYHTIFGLATLSVIYGIINHYVEPKKAFNYTITFGICSLLLTYSNLVLRDIEIAFIYSLSIYILLKRFRYINILILLIFMLIAWGLRLYSGLFCVSFILLYLYLYFQNSIYRFIIIPLFFVSMAVVAVFSVESVVVEQTVDEVSGYQEFTENRVSEREGLYATFYKLPTGLRELAMTLYSQMSPFPSYKQAKAVKNFPNLIMSLDLMLYEFWWYIVSFTVVASLVFKKAYRLLEKREAMLGLLTLVFIVVNTAHPDIRRMMPMYIVTYLVYIIIKEKQDRDTFVYTQRRLKFLYFFLLFIYVLIKG